MREIQDRAILNVTRLEGLWRVEHDGQTFGHSADKQVAMAAASRHARTMFDAGRPCQVKVWGEGRFWA